MCKAIDESKNREGQENDPPEPQDEEEILVEDIVGENTEQALPVIATTTNRSNTDITCHFGREKIAHWVTSMPTTIIVVRDSNAILPEIPVKKTVKDQETDEEHHNVEELTEGK